MPDRRPSRSTSPFARRGFLGGGLVAAAVCSLAEVTGCRERNGEPPAKPPGGTRAPAITTDSAPFANLTGFCDGVPPVDPREHSARVARLQAAIAAAGCAAIVVEAGVNLQYLTGVRWGVSERPLLYVVDAVGDTHWVAPAFEAGTLRRAGVADSVELRLWQEHEDPFALVVELLAPRENVLLDPAMRLFVADGLRRAGEAKRQSFSSESSPLDELRVIKDALEIARIRRANEATKAAIAMVAPHLYEGMRESECAALVQRAQVAAGLSDPWCLALFGPSSAFPHGSREDRALHPGDAVLVDTGGSLHGYCSDITRSWCFGAPDDQLRRAWATVRRAQDAALDQLRPGRTCGAVDAAAREVMASAGYGAGYESFTHRLGHGIGMQGHERPYLVRDDATVLRPGMTMSNEPGVYRRGAWGVRIEDIVVVTEEGCEVFGPRATSLELPFG